MKANWFEQDLIVVPIHHEGSHWTLMVKEKKKKGRVVTDITMMHIIDHGHAEETSGIL